MEGEWVNLTLRDLGLKSFLQAASNKGTYLNPIW